ncbi:MAG: hypothetical protein CGU28_08710 [Candidatus Dactylopiibacterium carminicum]|uniref:Lipoprotein SmpA/OmlA domain-containing protein n=1 Tax=Candidatus Dactylopiibacterium carminicum TaxID=857335 RepID=A0A272ES26_9RHOO|nr:hypothetical protein [Candidatus Dactylopiibacterium carminicum]KAF7598937.1 hypothetical protein BGI27_10735 [Candidatus Dactylopiibacterium carminicum]PAS92913.1 MAG: hypothetical protein CGU29_09820 [Candidatus Dactylopiibacterium carminicum]PAS96491.1 MAG: hypothetical protein CGU28_08710 [Candidatus Dactylopiibacterium carminicum]PAS98953.1 MAG: hypothetical protein BSR46_10755 [Candidatus Dactylopiibacterium carminicum]
MRLKLLLSLLALNILMIPSLVQATPGERQIIGKDSVHGLVIGEIIPGSRFAALQIGMLRGEVEQLLGKPDELQILDTGLASLYFGSFKWQTEQSYAGEGRLLFDRTGRLIQIDASQPESD